MILQALTNRAFRLSKQVICPETHFIDKDGSILEINLYLESTIVHLTLRVDVWRNGVAYTSIGGIFQKLFMKNNKRKKNKKCLLGTVVLRKKNTISEQHIKVDGNNVAIYTKND